MIIDTPKPTALALRWDTWRLHVSRHGTGYRWTFDREVGVLAGIQSWKVIDSGIAATLEEATEDGLAAVRRPR